MNMFKNRRRQLNKRLMAGDVDTVIISSPSNLYYYTGFTGGEAFFVMPVEKKEDVWEKAADSGKKEEGYVITDSRYYEQVERECPKLTLIPLEEKGYSKTVKELLDRFQKEGKVAIEDNMNLSQYLKLCETCPNYQFQVKGEVINLARMVKDAEEIEKIRKAEAIGDAAFSYIVNMIKPGVSEAEIALELEFFMKRQGATRLSFDTIVASGPNSSMPHAQVTDRKIEKGDFITMDFGCVYQGYCSDMTRTVAVGEPTEEMKQVYRIVLEANCRAMEGIMAGRRCDDIDALARNHIKECGYGEYFGHGLGHGVGLDIHEEPRFSPKCNVVIKENMVITDEPGIYLPGRFGVRIEDLVVVKKDGYEKLSHSEKELMVL